MVTKMRVSMSLSLCKLLPDYPPPHNRLPLKLLFIGSLIFLSDRGVDGAFLPSGRTRPIFIADDPLGMSLSGAGARSRKM